MSRGRRAIRLWAAAIFMIDAVRHFFHMLFGRPEPIEIWMLVADVLIVVLIVWLDMPEWFHKRKLEKRIASLIPYMDNGQTIQRDIAEVAYAAWMQPQDQTEAYAWTIKANAWTSLTNTFLESHSVRASTAFLLVVNAKESDRATYAPKYGKIPLTGELGDCYQILLVRLDNLRRIMERPEAYF